MWAFMESLFTPTSLFLLLNLIIGTIVISSRFHSSSSNNNNHPQLAPFHAPQHGLARAPSLIDRVKSINLSLYKFGHPEPAFSDRVDSPPLARASSLLERFKSINFSLYNYYEPPVYNHEPEPLAEAHHHLHRPQEPEFANQVDSPPLARAPSLLDRFKSLKFSLHNYEPTVYNHEPDPVHHHLPPENEFPNRVGSPPLARSPSLLERFKSINFYHSKYEAEPASHHTQHNHDQRYPEPDHTTWSDPNPPLARAPSLLERVKSIDFSSFYKPGQRYEDADALRYEEHDHGHDGWAPDTDSGGVQTHDHRVRRIKSETMAAGGADAQGKMKKSASERSPAGHLDDDHDEINAKADDFINKFKQQLKLQRLDSIMRYKEMLTGGTKTAR